MKKLGIGLLLLLLFLGLAAAVAVNRLLQDPVLLEDYLSSTLKREVRIGKLRELSLGIESTVLVEGLTIANPEWAAQPYLLQLSLARVHLDLPSLWRDGPIVISELELEGLRLALIESEQHPPNWQFGEPAPESDSQARESISLPVLLQQAYVSDSTITYQAPAAGLQAELAGQLTGGEGLALTIQGDWQDQPLRFNGHTSFEGGGVNLSGQGEYQQWQLSAEGTLADPLAFRGLDFQLALQGQLPLPAAEAEPARELPLHLDVQLTGSGRSLSLSRGLLVSGDSQLTLNGELGNPATLRGLDLDLVFDSPDIKPLVPLVPANERAVQVSLEGRLLSDGKEIRLQNIAGRSGGARLRGDLVAPLGGGLNGAEISLYAHGDSVVEMLSPWTSEAPDDAPFELDVEGHWRDPVWRLEKLLLQLGNNRLDATLALTPEETGTSAVGRVNISGKRAYRALEALGFSNRLPDDSYLLGTELALAADGALRLSDLDIQLGASDLHGQLYYQPGAPARVEAELKAQTLDMRFLAATFDREVEQAGGNTGSGQQLESSAPLTQSQLEARMIPATPLDVSWLEEFEGRVSLVIEEFIARDDLRSQGEFAFTIVDGKLASDKMQWSGDFSSGQASLTLQNAAPGASASLQLESHRLPLFWLFAGNSGSNRQSDYRITMAGRGATVQELATSLNGTVYLRGGGGRINHQGLNLFFGDVIGEIFSSINPMSEQEPYTQVECHSGGVVIKDGLATLDPGMVMRTDKIDIALGGTVDLNTEGLDLVFNTRSRTGVGISASKALTPYLKLGGNFSYPSLGVNAKGVVVSGGAAFATGGLSILAEGMWDRWVATSVNPCDALFEEGKEAESNFKKLFGRPL